MAAEPLPEGFYKARCVDAALGRANSGNEQIGMYFQITEGEHQGRVSGGYFSLTEAAAEFTLEKMSNAGWTSDDIADLSSLCPSEIECSILIKHNEWDGKITARVEFVNRALKVNMAAPLDERSKAQLAARLRGKVAAMRAGARPVKSAPKPATARPAAPPPGDARPDGPPRDPDDIPF